MEVGVSLEGQTWQGELALAFANLVGQINESIDLAGGDPVPHTLNAHVENVGTVYSPWKLVVEVSAVEV